MAWLGYWNAYTNTPTIINGTGTIGDMYGVSVAGIQDLGSGPIQFAFGCTIVLSGGLIWEMAECPDNPLTRVPVYRLITIDGVTQDLSQNRTWTTGSGSGTVTSVTSANSDATVANTTTTPVITIVSAPKLHTARNINGVAFDGTDDITVTASADTLTNSTLNTTVTHSSLTTLGTIVGGVWEATVIDVPYGGTNIASYTKGDLLVASGSTVLSKLPVGTDTYILTADSTQSTGMKWAVGGAGSGTVSSVSSATGDATVSSPTTTPIITIVSAPKLTTARTINGVSFDGTSNITVTAAAGTLTGTTLNSTVVNSSLTSLGTIATGIWNGTIITSPYIGLLTGGQVGITGLSATGTPSSSTYLRGDNTWATVGGGSVTSVSGTLNRIAVTGSTSVTVDIDAAYVGQSSLTTLGTITTGTWQGTKVGLAYGGTNTDLSATGGTSNYLKQASAGAAITVGTIPYTDITGTPTGLPPTGSAGGSLAGTYPNPSIASSVSLPGSPTTTTQTPADNSTKVATTAYVDAAAKGTDAKDACKYASTGALPSIVYANGSSGQGATLTGVALAAISLDSSSPAVNDRVLIKNQVSSFQNGIYIVTATGSGVAVFVLTRATDFDLSSKIDLGDSTFVTAGSTLANTTWVQNGTQNPIIGTNPITFSQTSGPGAITAGNGISITGLSVAIDTSITVDKTTAQALTNKTIASSTDIIGGVTMTLGSDASNDIYYRNSSGILTRLGNGTTGQFLAATTGAAPSWGSPSGSGTVTSVAMTVPSIMSIGGSPITTSGTLAVALATQSANLVFAGPSSGSAAIPTFRSLVALDLPDETINAQTGTTYTFALVDDKACVTFNNASAITATVPANATIGFAVGTQIDLVQIGAGTLTITPAAGVTINSFNSGLSPIAAHVGLSLFKTGTNTWELVGAVSTVGTVTSLSTDATLTGGPVTTIGTIGINLANTNNWTAAINEAKGTDIASATPNIGAATGNYIHVTGTTTITAFDTVQAGVERTVKFTGALTLTNNTAIVLPGGANITTVAGDVATFRSEGSGNWICTDYTKATNTGSGAMVFQTSPSLTTPTLGVASATTVNKVTLTTPATGSTLTIADGKTLTASNTLTFTGTDSSSVNFGAGGTMERIIAQSGVASSIVSPTGETNFAIIAIPAGVMNANGKLKIECLWKYVGTTASKQYNCRFSTSSGDTSGGVLFGNVTTGATVTSGIYTVQIWNANSNSSQMGFNAASITVATSTASTNVIATSSLNTSSTITYVNLNGLVVNASDTIQLLGYTVTLINP